MSVGTEGRSGGFLPAIGMLVILYAAGFVFLATYDVSRHEGSQADRVMIKDAVAQAARERAENKAMIEDLIGRVEKLEARP